MRRLHVGELATVERRPDQQFVRGHTGGEKLLHGPPRAARVGWCQRRGVQPAVMAGGWRHRIDEVVGHQVEPVEAGLDRCDIDTADEDAIGSSDAERVVAGTLMRVSGADLIQRRAQRL